MFFLQQLLLTGMHNYQMLTKWTTGYSSTTTTSSSCQCFLWPVKDVQQPQGGVISTWTSAHTVSSPRRWSALVPKIANVLGLDLPIVAKLCAGLQNVPHFKRKQPIILETDNLARRRHFFYYIKTIGVFIIWSKSWNKVFKKLLFSEHPWISGLQATIPPGFFKVL